MKLSIIIPVFNEEDSLKELHQQITDSIKMFEEYEIIFILATIDRDRKVEYRKELNELDRVCVNY